MNLHLTGLISRLAWYPLPLIHSILMRPDIPMTSDTPSLHQVLKILKQQIDAELPVCEESLEHIDAGRTNLIEREFRLVNARNNTFDITKSPGPNGIKYPPTTKTSSTTPPQLTPSSSYDPFKRVENKRKSITTSFKDIFRRPSSGHSNSSNGSGGKSFRVPILICRSLQFESEVDGQSRACVFLHFYSRIQMTIFLKEISLPFIKKQNPFDIKSSKNKFNLRMSGKITFNSSSLSR